MGPHRRHDAPRRGAILATLAAVIAVVLGGPVDSVPRAQAAPERCDGVWVVVDARVLDGPTTTRCVATERPIRGMDALTRAGHTVSDVPGQPGFVCRIDRRPDPCPGTPPADAYWSYWLAEPGGTWRYSQFGAGNREAAPGTVDGWAFGAGDPPSIPPPRPATEDRPDRDDGTDRDDGSTSPRSGGSSTDAAAGRSGGDAGSDHEPSASDDRGADASATDDATDADGQEGTSGAGAGDDGADDAAGRDARADDTPDAGDEGRDRAPSPSPDRVAGPLEGTSEGDDEQGDARDDRDSDVGAADGEVLVSRGDDGSGGSLVPVALGGGLLAGLAATAAWTSRRRAAVLDPDT